MSMLVDEIDLAALRAVEALGLGHEPVSPPLPDSAWRSFAADDDKGPNAGQPRWDRLLSTGHASETVRKAQEMPSLSAAPIGSPTPTFFQAPERVSGHELAGANPQRAVWEELALDLDEEPTRGRQASARPSASIADEIDLG